MFQLIDHSDTLIDIQSKRRKVALGSMGLTRPWRHNRMFKGSTSDASAASKYYCSTVISSRMTLPMSLPPLNRVPATPFRIVAEVLGLQFPAVPLFLG